MHRRSSFHAGEEQLDNAINQIKEAYALIHSLQDTATINVLFSGEVNRAFFSYYNRLYMHSPHFHFSWLRYQQRDNEQFTYGGIFEIPEIIRRSHDYDLKCSFSEKREHKRLKTQNEHYKRIYDSIMRLYPDIGESRGSRIIPLTEHYFREVFKIIKPQIFIMWNPFVVINRIAGHVARQMGIKVICAESGVLPGTTCFSAWGDLGGSRPAREPDYFLSLPVTDEEIAFAKKVISYLKQSGINRNEQPRKDIRAVLNRRIRRDWPVVFYAGQNDAECGLIPYDTRAKERMSPVFSSSESALYHIASLAKENNWNLIYKPHPLALGRGLVDGHIPPNVIYIGECDINELVDIADVVVTILSTSAYVALVRDKPAVMLGYIQLRGQGCAYEAYTKDKIEEQIKRALEFGYTREQREAFLRHAAAMNKYCLFDSLQPREIRYGRPIENVFEFFYKVIEGEAEF